MYNHIYIYTVSGAVYVAQVEELMDQVACTWFIHIYIHIYMYIYLSIYIYMYVCMRTYTYIYVYIYMHIHVPTASHCDLSHPFWHVCVQSSIACHSVMHLTFDWVCACGGGGSNRSKSCHSAAWSKHVCVASVLSARSTCPCLTGCSLTNLLLRSLRPATYCCTL